MKTIYNTFFILILNSMVYAEGPKHNIQRKNETQNMRNQLWQLQQQNQQQQSEINYQNSYIQQQEELKKQAIERQEEDAKRQAEQRRIEEERRIDKLHLKNPCYDIDVNRPNLLPASSQLDNYRYYLSKERRLEKADDVIVLWKDAKNKLGDIYFADVEKKLACWNKYAGKRFKKGKWTKVANNSEGKSNKHKIDDDVVELK